VTGITIGEGSGVAVGSAEGSGLGSKVGTAVGNGLGSKVGIAVGNGLGSKVGSVIGDGLGSKIESSSGSVKFSKRSELVMALANLDVLEFFARSDCCHLNAIRENDAKMINLIFAFKVVLLKKYF
jgi:hypothetical protein